IRQNAATMTGSGAARDGETVTGTGTAARIGGLLVGPDVCERLDIWKLNDIIRFSGFMNRCAMLDLDLLRSFVSVVDAGGFTRAGERVHRTQSTVSQQIRRLEDTLGRELVHRNGKQATPTEEGERLLSYARRILALADEARDVVARPAGEGVVRLG